MSKASTSWKAAVLLLSMVTLMLGLTVVWLGIERTDMLYGMKRMQGELEERRTLVGKLQVERENLVSHYRLRQEAANRGLGPAEQGQTRRVAVPEDN
ncbi:MAG: hypothetical protein D6E12_09825 [Desulfovibrio sp.]|nr:MAG: hypothetical protein D6E12_09825 [Desulfovibrio sp.]